MKKATNKNLIHFRIDMQLRACLVYIGYLVKGHLDEFDFEAILSFELTDEGIHGGRIVKLEVENMGGDKHVEIPRPVAFYDRKWANRPENDDEKKYCSSIKPAHRDMAFAFVRHCLAAVPVSPTLAGPVACSQCCLQGGSRWCAFGCQGALSGKGGRLFPARMLDGMVCAQPACFRSLTTSIL